MKTFELEFLPSALKEWNKLGPDVRDQFKKKLSERLRNPRVPSAKLHDLPDCYKIKLRSKGFRLVYRVLDTLVVVQVVAVGKRERNSTYKAAAQRLL